MNRIIIGAILIVLGIIAFIIADNLDPFDFYYHGAYGQRYLSEGRYKATKYTIIGSGGVLIAIGLIMTITGIIYYTSKPSKLENRKAKEPGNFCPKCGTKLSPEDVYCPNCGTKVKR